MRAQWGAGEAKRVGSVAELDELLDELSDPTSPIMVELSHPGGRSMLIGVGRSESVLQFVELDGSTFISVGDRDREGESVTFEFAEQPSEYMPGMAVPTAQARAAARMFHATGEAPSNIEWEQDS